jgi:hypothetical protein
MECKHILRRVRSDIGHPDHCGKHLPEQLAGSTWSGPYPSIYSDLDDYIEDKRNRIYPLLGFNSGCPIPPVLLTCRESFGVGSKFCTRSFSSLGSLPLTYFNFTLNTLYLDFGTHPYYLPYEMHRLLQSCSRSDELANIERLAIHDEIPCEAPHNYEHILCDILAVFGNVQKLTIVLEHYENERLEQGMIKEECSAQLVFLEPMDWGRRNYMFEHPEYHVNHEQDHVPEKKIFVPMIEDGFEVLRQPPIVPVVTLFPKPVVEYKILSTSTVKAKLEALQQAYEAKARCRCYESETVWLQYPERDGNGEELV